MNDWLDDDGEPLGHWVGIDADEWARIVMEEGGLKELTVAAALTDPEGQFGSPRIYTAWARREEDVPLVDCTSTEFEKAPFHHLPAKTIFRRFQRREC